MNGFCKSCNEYTFVDIINGLCINCQDDKTKPTQDGLDMDEDEQ